VRGATTNKGVYGDSNLLTKMNEAFGDDKKASGSSDEIKRESFYEKSRYADGKFIVRHFAGMHCIFLFMRRVPLPRFKDRWSERIGWIMDNLPLKSTLVEGWIHPCQLNSFLLSHMTR